MLYLARAPFVSGAERAMMSMLRHLDRKRVDPHLVLGHENELVDQARALDIPVTVLPFVKRERGALARWWFSTRAIGRLVKRVAPSVMHANDVPSAQAMSAIGAKIGVPRVMHVRWTITAADAAWWAYRGVESIICISQWIQEQLGATSDTPLKNASTVVLPDAVDWPADNAGPVPTRRMEPGGRLVVGFAGQLIESKGLDLVIEAMVRIPRARRPKLIVAGADTQSGGAYQRQLEQLARDGGVDADITWLGFLDDVTTLHQRVDAMVCPSREEPLGLVPLEAARLALPTLANRVGGLAETIVDTKTGILVEPDPDAWIDAFERAADHEWLRHLGAAAYERTKSHYSPLVYQAVLMREYKDVTDLKERTMRYLSVS